MTTYTYLGTNDDEDKCAHCGKTNLKAVVWLREEETGHIIFVGRICAANLLGIKKDNDTSSTIANKLYNMMDKTVSDYISSIPRTANPRYIIPLNVQKEWLRLYRDDYKAGKLFFNRGEGFNKLLKIRNEMYPIFTCDTLQEKIKHVPPRAEW